MGPSPRTLSAILHTVLLIAQTHIYQDKAFRRLPAPWPAEPDRAAKKRRPVRIAYPIPSYITIILLQKSPDGGIFHLLSKISRQHKKGESP